MSVAHVIHHGVDMDGVTGGAILYKFLKEQNKDVNMIPLNRGWSLTPLNDIIEGDEVYIVDYSLDMTLMKELQSRATKFIWLDHHISAIKDAEKHDFEAEGIQTIEFSGCELAWKYCYPEQPMPFLVKILGRYDVWDQTFAPTTFEVNEYMYMHLDDLMPGPENYHKWEKIFVATESDEVDHSDPFNAKVVLAQGRLLFKHLCSIYAGEAPKSAMEFTFTTNKEHSVLVANGTGGSVFFQTLDPTEYDILLLYYFASPKMVKYSIRTEHDHIDVSVIAKYFGGGGHRGAAGFVHEEPPWTLPGMKFIKSLKEATPGK